MDLVYAKLDPGNFGDELNTYLWPRLFPEAFSSHDTVDFVGIGTILSPFINRRGRRKVVFGSGAGYWKPPQLDETWDIFYVRGPKTARFLGIPENKSITDGAYCLRFLAERPVAPVGRIVFMPHHKSETEVDWESLCRDLGWTYASPTASVEPTLDVLRSAKLIVSEAMHGAIVADIYRIPWVPIRYGFRSLDFKWQDWCISVGLDYRPVDLPPLLDAKLGARDTLERAVKKAAGVLGVGKEAWHATPVFRSGRAARDEALKRLSAAGRADTAVLSADAELQRIHDRLSEQVEKFRRDYGR